MQKITACFILFGIFGSDMILIERKNFKCNAVIEFMKVVKTLPHIFLEIEDFQILKRFPSEFKKLMQIEHFIVFLV